MSASPHSATASAPLIDFLPQTVHVETQRRRDRPIKRLAVIAAVALCGLGVVMDRAKTASLIARRDALQTTAVGAVDQAEATRLKTLRASLDEQADLRATFLPTASASRLMATVAKSLPPETHLTSLRYHRLAAAGTDAKPPAETESLWVRDRFTRTQSRAGEQIEVIVEGITTDDAAIGELLSSLERSGLFDQSAVDLSEPAELRALPRRRFRMTLRRRLDAAVAASMTSPVR